MYFTRVRLLCKTDESKMMYLYFILLRHFEPGYITTNNHLHFRHISIDLRNKTSIPVIYRRIKCKNEFGCV